MHEKSCEELAENDARLGLVVGNVAGVLDQLGKIEFAHVEVADLGDELFWGEWCVRVFFGRGYVYIGICVVEEGGGGIGTHKDENAMCDDESCANGEADWYHVVLASGSI